MAVRIRRRICKADLVFCTTIHCSCATHRLFGSRFPQAPFHLLPSMLPLPLVASAVGALSLAGTQASTVPMLFSTQPDDWSEHNYRACGKAMSIRSCSNATWVKANSPEACCTNTWIDPRNETDPGMQSGSLLVTQFWDSGAVNTTASLDSTTIHGLWPGTSIPGATQHASLAILTRVAVVALRFFRLL